jgi:ABC-type multidrug transport system fused ATPase/permease subunit
MTFTEKLKKILTIMLGMDVQTFPSEERMTVEQIQVRVWAFVILTISFVFASTVLIAIISLIFTIQPMLRMAPIDAIFAKQVNDAMLLSGGVLGGVAGMSFVNAGVNYVYKKLADEQENKTEEDKDGQAT